MSEGVEWVIHTCTVLAALPEGQALPAARLAEFHGVPPAYLAKHLQAAAAAGIVASVPGRHGGYRLARPPGAIPLLDIVVAVDGDDTAFRCSEIRRRGPVQPSPDVYAAPCGIARAMWRAEEAWRAELRATTVGDIVAELLVTLPPDLLLAGAEWVRAVDIRRRTPGTARRDRDGDRGKAGTAMEEEPT